MLIQTCTCRKRVSFLSSRGRGEGNGRMRRGGEANRTFGRRCFLGIANFGRRCLLGRRPSSTLSFALVRCSVLLDLQAQGNQHGISECQLKQIRTQCHDRQIQQTGRSCRHTPNQNRGNGNRFMITCSCTACSKARRHLHNSIQLPQLISNCRARDPIHCILFDPILLLK